jgi:glycosyltransferase involved in cell wall biosynthesis
MLRLLPIITVVHFQIDPSPEEIRWSLRHVPDAVITCSRHIGGQVRSVMEEDGRRIRVVPIQNSIDLDRYAPGAREDAKRKVGAVPGRPLVVMLANLSEHKGQATAVRALKVLQDRGVVTDLWLVGEEREGQGTFTRALEKLAADLGVAANVRLLGFRTDGPDLLRAADFFLLPSTHEGLPLSLLEAQASGTLVVASPIPGIREVVEHGRNGFLVDSADPAGYADRIQAMITDPESYRRISAAALEGVRREQSLEVFVHKVWGVYSDLSQGRRAA